MFRVYKEFKSLSSSRATLLLKDRVVMLLSGSMFCLRYPSDSKSKDIVMVYSYRRLAWDSGAAEHKEKVRDYYIAKCSKEG